MNTLDQQEMHRPGSRIWIAALLAFAGAALVGLAFAGWSEHGQKILLGMIENGLSWCL